MTRTAERNGTACARTAPPSRSACSNSCRRPRAFGLLQAAQHAATAAEGAEQTLKNTAAAVLGLVLLVSLMLAVSISVPVRRLTAATRRLAGGDRGARAPRGGSAEIDELANPSTPWPTASRTRRRSCALTRRSSSITSPSGPGSCIISRTTIR